MIIFYIQCSFCTQNHTSFHFGCISETLDTIIMSWNQVSLNSSIFITVLQTDSWPKDTLWRRKQYSTNSIRCYQQRNFACWENFKPHPKISCDIRIRADISLNKAGICFTPVSMKHKWKRFYSLAQKTSKGVLIL